MKDFASDNYAGIHPNILTAIIDANQGHTPAYGNDDYTQKAVQQFREQFGKDTEAFFVLNGTAANVLALAAITRPYQAIICAETAHLQVDECGAPEHFIGCKMLLVPTLNGKITVSQLEPYLLRMGDQHHVQPKVISIAQTTELGTVYTPEEIEAIANFAHQHQLLLHMDGARICNAAAALQVELKAITKEVGVDVLSFGGTKNGMMAGEAVVFFNPREANEFQYIRKQGMQLPSKMRFISAQFTALFRDRLWYHNAYHANLMAKRLADGLANISQIQITQVVEANAVFAIIPKKLLTKLQENYLFYIWNEVTSEVRWMTAFDTKEEDIDSFVGDIKSIISENDFEK